MKPFFILLLHLQLLAQPANPQERIAAGFKTLPTGGWSEAINEWEKQGLPRGEGDMRVRSNLSRWVPKTWSLSACEPVRRLRLSPSWQRQWWIASFDQGVIFFLFDHVLHQGEWRLFRLDCSQDPRLIGLGWDLAPNDKERLEKGLDSNLLSR